MWLLAGVLAQVHREISFAGYGLAAHRTHILVLRSHVTVGLHVHQQYLLPGEAFVA